MQMSCTRDEKYLDAPQVVHLETRLSFLVGWLSDHHAFNSFALGCIGFCTFILRSGSTVSIISEDTVQSRERDIQISIHTGDCIVIRNVVKLNNGVKFGWTHITLLMVVATASCMIKVFGILFHNPAQAVLQNMYDGMIWFFVPVCLVIWNDVYACNIFVSAKYRTLTPFLYCRCVWAILGQNASD